MCNAAFSFKNVRNRCVLSYVLLFLSRLSPPEYPFLRYLHATHIFICAYRIVSFCDMKELKTLEKVCKLTNNGQEVQDIVEAIRKGLVAGIKKAEEITEIRGALTHLCYMTEKLQHAADVRQ